MPPSTRRPGRRLRSTATLPTPFCRLTIDDIGRRVPRDDIGHLGGIGALDRHQHHAGIAEDRRIFRQRELVRTRSFDRSLQSSSAAGRWPRFPRSRAGAPAARHGGRRPPACRRRSSRCCRPPRCRSSGPNSFQLLSIAAGFDSRTCGRCLSNAQDHAGPAPCNRHGPPLCFSAGLTRGRRRPWVYSTYSTACRTARAARAPRAHRSDRRRDVADDHGDPGAAGLEGGQAFRRRPAWRGADAGAAETARQRDREPARRRRWRRSRRSAQGRTRRPAGGRRGRQRAQRRARRPAEAVPAEGPGRRRQFMGQQRPQQADRARRSRQRARRRPDRRAVVAERTVARRIAARASASICPT